MSVQGMSRLAGRALLRVLPWWALLWLGVAPGAFVTSARASSISDQVANVLRDSVEMFSSSAPSLCRSEQLCGPGVLSRFYTSRSFRPVWSRDGHLLPLTLATVKIIEAADRDGLRPSDYHLAVIDDLLLGLAKIPDPSRRPPRDLAELDILLTDGFFLYGSHLLGGRVDPVSVQPEWVIDARQEDLAAMIQEAVRTGSPHDLVERLRPAHSGYDGLQHALNRLQKRVTAGGWPRLPSGENLEKGSSGTRVALLRVRLRMSGDLVELNPGNSLHFDADLDQAVRRFQNRHGLEADGVVGPLTLAALNVSAEERVNQIAANLERWRWLPRDLGRRYILVNIADFSLHVVEAGQDALTMRVVVGRKYRHTPVFSSAVKYLEVNPYWHVPPSIALKDLLPKIREDPGYLSRQGIRVFEGWHQGAAELPPERIDWEQVNRTNFSYKLRQDPGPENALGRIKFMFPNPFSVYLHDTPARELFERTRRSFSSGCIRLEKPLELADYLLAPEPGWNQEKIREITEGGKTRIVPLSAPVPIYILYWTSWIDERGWIHFREDIYGRDERLQKALETPPPTEPN